ncbi:MAG: FKBP-type peptidyl-prolyl cis-trans isomerase [Prevotellaceae bacterium]|jgi:FKBP-type peptidyl-prolyl cis-trans isomerase SlyD|nr:FKBP-type peptidyl-prolyl cis-trans isomerase [Prevotellaceae bacterium]
MEKTADNRYITVAYKLYAIDEDGRDFAEEATAEQPFQFVSGLGMTLDAFEEQVKNLQTGDAFDFVIGSADAYGEYNDDHVVELPRSAFEVDGKFDSERVVEGNILPMMTVDGQRINGLVTKVADNVVVMDLNHPFAGSDLNFVGTIVESREATQDELVQALQMLQGGGGCSCGCGCGDDCDCGEGEQNHCGCGGGCGCN